MNFAVGHAAHEDWRVALAAAAAQVDELDGPWTLGIVYFTDAYAPHAEAIVSTLKRRYAGVSWAGCVGIGVCAGGVEYFDEPALVLMLAPLAAGSFELFSGLRPFTRGYGALVHADPETPDLGELIHELASRADSGYVFGGVAASRAGHLHVADGVWHGGLSGVAFTKAVPFISRVTQGCQPIGATRRITRCSGNVVEALDDEPALPVLLRELGIGSLADHRSALTRLRATLAGIVAPGEPALDRGGQFGADVRVRHLVGIDPGRQAVAIADHVEPGMRLAFCSRDVHAARRDLVRICSEIREEVESATEAAVAMPTSAAPGQGPPAMRGAIYISCAGRGGPHFGGPSAELKIVQHALGDVPLVGFFSGGEIARHHIYGYTGVLTVFT